MACKDCNQIETPSCGTCYCDDTVCTPCEYIIADRCIKITSELTNIGTCLETQGNYECSDLNTVLEAIDSLLDNCADGGCNTNTVSDGVFNRICNEVVTIDYPSNATTLEPQLSGNIAYMRYWAADSEAIIYVDEHEARLVVDDGTNIAYTESRGAYLLHRITDGTDTTSINMTTTTLDFSVTGISTFVGLTNFGSGATNAAALAALGANALYIKEDADGDKVIAIA